MKAVPSRCSIRATEADCAVCFAQRGVDSNAMVEDKAFAVVVGAATVLEIFEYAAVELLHIAKAFAFHEGSCLLATNAARAEHHDRLFFHCLRQQAYRGGKITEVIEIEGARIAKRAEL